MLVKATKKGYYGDRIRDIGVTFNYTPNNKKNFDNGKENLPSWMIEVKVDEGIDPEKLRNDKLEELSSNVAKAKQVLAEAEATAAAKDDILVNAKAKDKPAAQDMANVANEAVDNAAHLLSDAEDALAEAESK